MSDSNAVFPAPKGTSALPHDATMPEMLKHLFARNAELECVVGGGQRLTYADVDRESAMLALGLHRSGIGKGTRVGILLPNGPEWIVALAAVARAGAVAVGVSTFLKGRELGYVLRHADVDTLLIANSVLGHDYVSRLEEVFSTLSDFDGANPLELAEAPFLRRIWTTGPVTRGWFSGAFEDLKALAAKPPSIGREFLAQLEAAVSPADLALMIYTSGSTADPKGVVHTHDTIVRHAAAVSKVMYLERGDRICAAMPFFWVGGLVATMLPAFHKGATLICPASQSPEELSSLMAREGITHLSGWGNVLAAVMDHSSDSAAQVGKLRPMTDAQRLFFSSTPKAQIPNQLGMTETFGHHSSEPSNTLLGPGQAGSFGRAMPGVERKIVDPETGERMPDGEIGELCVRGYSVMAALYKIERWRTFDADGWYHTGDRCSIAADGHLYFHGRYGEMIKTSGANVSPAEVENVFRTLPEVVDVAVLGLPDPIFGEIVCAAVVLKAGRSVTEAELKERLRDHLSSFKIPKRIHFFEFDALPRTESGKVRKHLLRGVLARPTE